jgi:Bifunctional DNA primase/polymerase, N-terminal
MIGATTARRATMLERLPTVVETALQYAGRGWRVLPTFNKEPPRGFARGVWAATTNPTTIIQWWERWPQAEIAIACGRPVVVDIDDPSAVPALMAPRDTTLSASTPRGSVHLYFEGDGIRNQNFAWGEVRSHGYYVVAPTAPRRKWLNNLPLAPLPEWLAKIDPKTNQPQMVTSLELPQWSEAIRNHHQSAPRWSREDTIGHFALSRAMQRVYAAPNGKREIRLNGEAYAIGRLVGAGWLPLNRAALGIEHAIKSNPHKNDRGQTFVAEHALDYVRWKILRALHDGMAKPYPALKGR